jgi:hypothetical protein
MRRRWWRWVAVGIVVIVGFFFALDVVSVQYLESRGAAEIARTMSAEEATVDLGGFPFIPRFLSGRLTGVSVMVQGASASGGLRVQSIEARMQEVQFSPGQIFALARSSFATRTKVTATEPLAILELGQQDLEDFVRRAIPLIGDLRVKASGIEVRFLNPDEALDRSRPPTKNDLTKPARYLPVMRNGQLSLSLISVSQIAPIYRADAGRLERVIDLPRLPSGLNPDVTLRDGVVVVQAQGAKVSLVVGEGEGG